MTKTARQLALNTLIKVFRQQSYSNISLNHELEHSQLSSRDRQLATRIVYGTIQEKIFLDYQLDQLLKTKLREPYLRPLLLMSLYQIQFMDKIPANAAVDEANKLAKQFGGRKSASYRLVNGILRSYLRQGPVYPPKNQQWQYLSVKESMPIWLVKLFSHDFGLEKTKAILSSYNKSAQVNARLALKADLAQVIAKLQSEGFAVQKSKLRKGSLVVAGGNLTKSSCFKAGLLTLQDAAASLVVDAFELNGDEQVLDACAAPGGKTVQIAERLTTGQVTALDIHAKKLNLIRQNALRMHVNQRIVTKCLDARRAAAVLGHNRFDAILVDAPCSGLGLLRRKPEIRYTKTKQDLAKLSQVQLAILEQVADCLKNKGQLVYSTCSISTNENEAVIKQFLELHPEFQLAAFTVGRLKARSGMLKVLPIEADNDGFFIAKLQKVRG